MRIEPDGFVGVAHCLFKVLFKDPGYRSSVAGSLLQSEGWEAPLYNVVGGTSAWVAAGFPTENS